MACFLRYPGITQKKSKKVSFALVFLVVVGQFLDSIFVKICANFYPNPENSNKQEIFWIFKIKVFWNDNFPISQVVEPLY